MSNELVEVTVEIKRETEKAYLVNDGETETWIPKSQIDEEMEVNGGAVVLAIPGWLAEEKELV